MSNHDLYVPTLSVALTYAPSQEPDILKALIPTYTPDPAFDISTVDPLLWATIAQIYGTSLPNIFTTYPISLQDTHLPRLRSIPPTPTFALITVLELPGCPQLTDDTAITIKSLPLLTAFDASDTAFSSWGVRKLLMPTLDSDWTGPWGLRILRLRNCKAVDQTLFKALQPLKLLSVLDLRGTSVDPNGIPSPFAWYPTTPDPAFFKLLFHPTPLTESISALQAGISNFQSSTAAFRLHINTFEKPRRNDSHPETAVKIQGEAFAFTSDTMLSHDPQPLDTTTDYMLAVAEKESQEMVSHQKIRNFYAPILRVPPSSSHANYYSAAVYYAKFARDEQAPMRRNNIWPSLSFSDRPLKRQKLSTEAAPGQSSSMPLMLYRSPASWSPVVPVVHKSNSDTVYRDQSSTTSRQGVTNKSKRQIISDLKRGISAPRSRRAKGDAMATFDGARNLVSAKNVGNANQSRRDLPGKNPFRRSAIVPTSADGFTSERPKNRLSSFRSASEPKLGGFDEISNASSSMLKDLLSSPSSFASDSRKQVFKPISHVRIPPLPLDELRKLKDSMADKFGAKLRNSSATNNSSSHDREYSRRKSFSAGDCKDGISNTPSGESARGRQFSRVGFDWKAWGAK
ncbi:hypothetical protein D9757_001900 [Collybiopsis confluens]|uniref:Uncharacterized protein n=1 Tax=Collybiopsis confluens TaxID=2823264 RepID=A0A8H5HXL2_9AGAR|nr:hypothetical protein D9757_001900 [Collybiopsis confluens]